MPITINGSTGISGVDGSAGTPALIGSDADTGIFVSAGQVSASLNGTAANVALVSGTAQNSTSGTSIDFTGIPSWVKRVTVMFNGVSTNGTSSYLIQLGTGASPTYLTSTYSGSVVRAAASTTSESTNSTGFRIVDTIAAASTNFGTVNLANITGNTWVESGVVCLGNVGSSNTSGGSVSLSAALTAIRITTVNGTDTFDAGSINILYE